MSRALPLPATLCLACAALLGGCAVAPPAPPAAPTVSVARLLERPAERDLVAALRLYEDGLHERSEALFRRAVGEGLRDPHDRAIAHKHLAFLACAYSRPADCEAAFRAAFAADPRFRLTDAEIGHPLWGPVYQRIAAEQPPSPAAK